MTRAVVWLLMLAIVQPAVHAEHSTTLGETLRETLRDSKTAPGVIVDGVTARIWITDGGSSRPSTTLESNYGYTVLAVLESTADRPHQVDIDWSMSGAARSTGHLRHNVTASTPEVMTDSTPTALSPGQPLTVVFHVTATRLDAGVVETRNATMLYAIDVIDPVEKRTPAVFAGAIVVLGVLALASRRRA